MRIFYISVLGFLLSNSIAEAKTFTEYCTSLDTSNAVVSSVRVKTIAVYSMRLSATDDAKKVRAKFTDMVGGVTDLAYQLSSPSPTDNIIIDYLKQAMINNILLDVCYDPTI